MTNSKDGILTHQDIDQLIAAGAIRSGQPDCPVVPDQVQPTSLDLRLGPLAYRIRAGFLPRQHGSSATLNEHLNELTLYTVNLSEGAVLECGQLFLIPLVEELHLSADIRGRCNPKSSTGRLDIFTRVITAQNERFDDVQPGYQGKLYLEIMARSFPIKVHAGNRLNQIRFLRGVTTLSDAQHEKAHREHKLVTLEGGTSLAADQVIVNRGLHMRVGLQARGDQNIIGYKARRFTGVIDLNGVGTHDPDQFFEPIAAPAAGRSQVLLEPEEFYIFASRERIRVPSHLAAEMVAYDVGIGELRTNYAGFFDAGFGWGIEGEQSGTPAVLEVRPHDVPFMIDDGQILFSLEFHRTTRPCERLYGEKGRGSNYAAQGLTLAKHFRRP